MKYLIKSLFIYSLLISSFCCRKIDLTPKNKTGNTVFVIHEGNHYCEDNNYRKVETDEFKFTVKFDSSAIYQTALLENQEDINKLYGFSDNEADHHIFSARFGWRWSNQALRLFTYVYNSSELSFQEIGTIEIGREYTCSIKVTATSYIFSVNGKTIETPRASITAMAKGYKLYPYFGGDEGAPHDIQIRIQE